MSSSQTWDPERYSKNARFVSDLGLPVVELLNPKPGERILDLGCGDGALTEKIVSMGCHVVGIDSSTAHVEAVRRMGIRAFIKEVQEALRPELCVKERQWMADYLRLRFAALRAVHD